MKVSVWRNNRVYLGQLQCQKQCYQYLNFTDYIQH
jgi:hypothetical protein